MTARRTMVVLGAALLVAGGGVATANWLLEGTGPGATSGATIQPLEVSAGTPTTGLYPEPTGGYPSLSPAVGTVVAQVRNPNSFPVRLTSATVGQIDVTAAANRTCAAGNVVAAATTVTMPTAAPVVVAPGATSVQVMVPAAVRMLPTAPIGCQGVLVNASLTFAGVPA